MEISEIVSELDVFASWPRSFTFGEILDLMNPSTDHETLRCVLLDDSRFIFLRSGRADEDRFILDSVLFRWFSHLNVRLAQARQFRLSERQVAILMSHLREDGKWDSPPTEAIRWGRSLGLIGSCYTPGQYVFPLAWLLSFMSLSSIQIAADVLKDFAEKRRWKGPLKKLLEESLQNGFSQFIHQAVHTEIAKKAVHVVKAREALLTGTKTTLEQLGTTFGLTRERIRQLEKEFWYTLSRSKRMRRSFLIALVCDFMDESGSLIVSTTSQKAPLRRFLVKCGGIPHVELLHIGLLILVALPKHLTSLKFPKSISKKTDADAIANRLDSKDQVSLFDSDVKILAESMANFLSESMAKFRRKPLRATDRVYLALRAIGRPAHYSEVADVNNFLFPDHLATDRNIHAALSREQHGVVWIGVRGTFALKEWGYEHPSKSLFETVTEIVKKKYKRTRKPVRFAVIMAEIGKYRRFVKPSSLTIAAHCNPNLRSIFKDSFIPKGPNDKVQDEISADQLDKILQKLRERL